MKAEIFAVCILIGKFIFIQGYQYNVPQIIPAYINASFYSIPGLIFPRDIQIEISLSRVAGTLLYSIDNNDNQLIVSLSDSNEATLIIEGNKVQSYVSIPLLCRCEWCRYERLRLRMQMRDKMYIQCNGGQIQSIEYSKGAINKDYPIPKFSKSDKLSAYLWLVNTPLSDGIFPNGEQLTGCIFGVWYDGIEVKMETHGVGDKCQVTCIEGVCNDGKCLETYNGSPLCNCTSSFMNGLFCNDTMVSHNVKVSKPYVFKTIKLSSRSTSGDIMELRNRDTSLKVFTKDRTLTLRISHDDNNGLTHEGALSFAQYEREENHILVMEFGQYFVDVKYLSSNTSLKLARVNVHRDLSRQRFSNIVLQSGDGLIDMVYKNNLREPRWTDISYDGDVINIAKQAILYPKNIDVDRIKNQVNEVLPGQSGVFLSTDRVDSEDEKKIGSNISINLETLECNCTNKPNDTGINYGKSPTINAGWIVAISTSVIYAVVTILVCFYSICGRERIRNLEAMEMVPSTSMENNHKNNIVLYSIPRSLSGSSEFSSHLDSERESLQVEVSEYTQSKIN